MLRRLRRMERSIVLTKRALKTAENFICECPNAFVAVEICPAQCLLPFTGNRIYNMTVEITFDSAKNERNIRERGLSFELAAEFDFENAVTHVEQRGSESRIVSVGYLGNRLHVLCYLETARGIRVISFRKANRREAEKYGIPKTLD